jgi:hypothetical protein
MSVLADDGVVMHQYSERPAISTIALHIRLRGRRIAGRMIVRSKQNFIQVVIAALRESPVGTFETCPDVCLPVAIRGKADVTRT